MLVSDPPRVEKADTSQLRIPVQAVLARGIESVILRDDLGVGVLSELLAGAALSAIKLARHHGLGLEEASVAAASLFLDGARRPTALARLAATSWPRPPRESRGGGAASLDDLRHAWSEVAQTPL